MRPIYYRGIELVCPGIVFGFATPVEKGVLESRRTPPHSARFSLRPTISREEAVSIPPRHPAGVCWALAVTSSLSAIDCRSRYITALGTAHITSFGLRVVRTPNPKSVSFRLLCEITLRSHVRYASERRIDPRRGESGHRGRTSSAFPPGTRSPESEASPV